MKRCLILILSWLISICITGCNNDADKNSIDQVKAEKTITIECDRNCLEGFVNQYLEAMVANDLKKAPFADTARYTENAEEIPLAGISKGLWTKATGLTDYKFYVADPEAGQVAFVGLIKTKKKQVR